MYASILGSITTGRKTLNKLWISLLLFIVKKQLNMASITFEVLQNLGVDASWISIVPKTEIIWFERKDSNHVLLTQMQTDWRRWNFVLVAVL